MWSKAALLRSWESDQLSLFLNSCKKQVKIEIYAGIKVSDVDIWEINEAFASQATYCVEKLGINKAKLNPKGGAIALGHPLGCTGSRQIATLLPELHRTKGRYGVVSMCIGTGMGAAALIERE